MNKKQNSRYALLQRGKENKKKAKNTLFNRENAQTVTISRHIRKKKKKTQYTHNLRNKLQKKMIKNFVQKSVIKNKKLG